MIEDSTADATLILREIQKQGYQPVYERVETAPFMIAALEKQLADAEVVDVSKLSGDRIEFGARVTLLDDDSYETQVWQIVGEPEADASVGRISIVSPPARVLIGKKKGASIEIVTPGGPRIYRVLDVQYR